MNSFKNFLALYKYMSDTEKANCINELNTRIKNIGSSRSGNGAYFGSSRCDIEFIIRVVYPYFIGAKHSYHATIDIEYLDGTKEYLDNEKDYFLI